jgi:hypothetical protein
MPAHKKVEESAGSYRKKGHFMKLLVVLRTFWRDKLPMPVPVGIRAFAAGMPLRFGMFQSVLGVLFFMVIAIEAFRSGVFLLSPAVFAVAGIIGSWCVYRGPCAIRGGINGTSNLEGGSSWNT